MTDRTCIAPDCDRDWFVKSRKLCTVHYQRFMKTGSTELPPKPIRICKVEDCGRELIGSSGRGMCNLHYSRWRRHGTTEVVVQQWWHEDRVKLPTRCTEDGCDKPHKTGGLCAMHASRMMRGQRPVMCAWCWEIFTPIRGSQRCCSDECSSQRREQYARDYQTEFRRENPKPPVEMFPAKCIFCHTEFMANRRKFQYCSATCYLGHRARGDDPYSQRRNDRLRAATTEKFTKWEVFDRDGWVCQICAEPIDRTAIFPDAYSASLDHIIPLSKDGKHCRANCRATHLICNVRKGSKAA